MYEYVPRSKIIGSLRHLRELLRQTEPANELDRLAADQREVVAKYLISNLPRTGEHPTLKSLLEVSETFRLTLGAAHQLFGYNLDALRREELLYNVARTHIVESYVFDRDRLIDLPAELAAEEAFRSNAMLYDLVRKWQPPVPIRTVEKALIRGSDQFYVHIGTEDSETSSLPPGAMALVKSIDPTEALRPNPKLIYLLQFGDGYKCSRCVVTHGKLQMLTPPGKYVRAREFASPGEVRVAGRIRMFAHQLPQPRYARNNQLPSGRRTADLVLPWEQRSRHELLTNEHRRFQRTEMEEAVLRDQLNRLLHSSLSQRTERRYRGPGLSEPHVSTLIQLTLLYFVCYSDALRVGGSSISDHERYSLDAMLHAEKIEQLRSGSRPQSPKPEHVWIARRREFLDWVPLLSFKFPQFSVRDLPIARLSHACILRGIEPPLASGSWMLLHPTGQSREISRDPEQRGWERPLYVLRRGLDLLAGYLDTDSTGFALLTNVGGSAKREMVRSNEMSSLQQVVGVAVPV